MGPDALGLRALINQIGTPKTNTEIALTWQGTYM